MKLIAHASEIGWAYLRSHEGVWLVKPPYDCGHTRVTNADVEHAVTVHGYLARDLYFETDAQLVTFLRDELVKDWKLKEAPEKLTEDILELSSSEEITIYISEAIGWVYDNRTSEAETLCNRLLTAKNITALQVKAINLILKTVTAQYLETYARMKTK